jgi:hypothetical protein
MKSVILAALSCIIIFTPCKKNGTTITSAQAIEGSYIAYKYLRFDSVINYQTNGKTITMQIDAIGEDSVRLQMRSVQNGFYSPGDTVIDRHIYVQKTKYSGYLVTLGDPVDPGTSENTIVFDDSYSSRYQLYSYNGYYGYYIYVPPGYKQGAVQTIFTKMQ